MNEISRTAGSAPPSANPILERSVLVALSGATMREGEVHLLPGKSLGPEMRRMAVARLSILSQSLDGRDNHVVAAAISRMLGGFPSLRQSGDSARALLTSYTVMVEDFPPWAVTTACQHWGESARREGRSLAFPPSAEELREECRRVVRRPTEERGRLTQVLAARTAPALPGERSRVSAGFDALRQEVAATLPPQKRPPTAAEARANLERTCAELGIDPAEIDRVKDQPLSFRKLHAPVDVDLPCDVEAEPGRDSA